MKYHPITFPADSGAHNAIIEWWYFNGHLKDKNGNKYSFMDCLFKADPRRANIPYINKFPGRNFYFAHSILCDIKTRVNYKAVQHVSLMSRDSFKKPLMYASYINPLNIPNFTNCEIKELSPHNFFLKTENFSLNLESQKEPLLEGGKGFVKVCGHETYYYSLTDMKVTGSICINNKWIEVEGKAWLDRQWADTAFAGDKWTWFSFQLENGTDIMCIEYGNGKTRDYLVDMIHADGTQEHFSRCKMQPSKEIWRSKKTKAEYPLNWRIEIPDKNFTVEARSIMQDQEMIFGAINYWEGPMEIVAVMDGKKVRGKGFMELVGYPSDYNYLLLVTKKLYESVTKIFSRKTWKSGK